MSSRSRAYNEKRGCPSGFHKRKSYLSLLGFKVPRRCIRSTSVYRNRDYKRGESARRSRHNKLYVPSIKSLSRKACPPGMIERKAFAREYSTAVRQKGYTVRRASGTSYKVYPKARKTTVKSQCIKNIGRSRRSEKTRGRIGPLRKGELHKHGYSFKLKGADREKALRHAIKEYGPLGVYRKLNAVAKLSKTAAPRASNIFKSNRNWIVKQFGPLKSSK